MIFGFAWLSARLVKHDARGDDIWGSVMSVFAYDGVSQQEDGEGVSRARLVEMQRKRWEVMYAIFSDMFVKVMDLIGAHLLISSMLNS